jgi:hypothetical protein
VRFDFWISGYGGHLEFWFPDDKLRKTSQIDLIFLRYNADAQQKVPFDFWCDLISAYPIMAILNMLNFGFQTKTPNQLI